MTQRSLTPILALWFGYLAWAAPCLGQIHLALGAGPSVPLGDLGDGSTVGFHVIGMTFLGFDQEPVSGRLDLSYSHFYADVAGQNQATNVLAVGAAAPLSIARPNRPGLA